MVRISRLALTLMVHAGLVAALASRAAGGASGAKSWDDPRRAAAEDADFAIQGEYASTSHGLQVVALGGGNFYVAKLRGGLPGAGWDGRTVEPMRATTEQLKTLITRGRFRKKRRSSPTMGARPPRGAIHLFDEHRPAQTVKNWDGGKLTADGLLKEGTKTARPFGSFKLHMEFLLPYKPSVRPSNQDRGNSGVYTFNRYETQLLDSFGLHFYHIDRDQKGSSRWKEAFKEHLGFGANSDRTQWCGCFYKFKTPSVNMCLPPLAWQTYDITFTAPKFEGGKKVRNARITVVHNGVKVHDDVELPKGTGAGGGRTEVPRERIYLQGHGNPVRFRNIWIVELDT